MTEPVPPPAAERVLSTLNADGTRRWIRPKLSRGRYWKQRLWTAWILIGAFTVMPYLRLNGKPLILLDVARREFTLFGATFLPTDTVLLMLLLVGIFVGIFLLTAILGRVWCGWACPQTVYMEFLYRPLEALIEGSRARQIRLDREGPDGRRIAKNAVFVLISTFLAHTFLAYFVGVDTLLRWVTRSPVEHPGAFAVMACTAALMMGDFGRLREQVCIVACPYGRFQSVLLDRRSLIVGYDAGRGEPRRRLRARAARADAGDCVDCDACVVTCPTGIDIREGLQMECIHCTQCIDACDAVMDKIGRPRGLVRYTSRDELSGAPRRVLRPRIVIYPLIIVAAWGALGVALARRPTADVTVLRGLGVPYTQLPTGEISNAIRVKIVNRSGADRRYTIEIRGGEDLRLVAPENPLPVSGGRSATASVFVLAPARSFRGGTREIRFAVLDGEGFSREEPYRILGPEVSP